MRLIPMRSNERLELYSSLPLDECARRISDAIDSERSPLFSLVSLFGSHPVAGRVDGFSLSLRKRIGYRNSFQSHLTATMRAEGSGTLVSGEFAMHPFVRVFMTIWFSGVILIGGTMFIVATGAFLFGSPPRGNNAWVGIFVPPVMVAFGFALVRFGRYLARDEARFITEFLVRVLNANDRKASSIAESSES